MPDVSWRVRWVNAWYRGAWWLWLLQPLAFFFRGASALRRWLYRRGVLRVTSFTTPVVVVGNITVGGTGKTPVVIALVEALAARGIRAGVVSRGYGAQPGHYPRRVTDHSTAQEVGDEPLLIHRRTGCPCAVDPARPRAVTTLLSEDAVDIVISDDGLQHYALDRSLEILLYDVERGFGNGFCLPAGPLREPLSRLRQADYVLARGSEDRVSGVALRSGPATNVQTGEVREFTQLPGYPKVQAVTGIANPGAFFTLLEDLGLQVQPRVFPDHHKFQAEDFAGLGPGAILMTEKDAVKCRSLAGANAWSVALDARLPAQVIDAVAALVTDASA